VKAMILAAGLGTRLRPLTEDRPKALVQVAGRTMLEITLSRLRAFQVREVIVNVHHFADMVVDYLRANDNFGMRIAISREDPLLDTGGGLKKASPFFLEDSRLLGEPFLLHNVDVISTIDLARMVRFHLTRNALSTLAVQHRESSRYLLFNHHSELCGRRKIKKGEEVEDELVRPDDHLQPFAFSGVHVISPRLLTLMRQEGTFSIIDSYLDLAARGERIVAFRDDEAYWCDLGKPESLSKASRDQEKWTRK
jgi:NDP-sugar pyrophosphorylase family protein